MRIAEFLGFRPTLRYLCDSDASCPAFMGEPAPRHQILSRYPTECSGPPHLLGPWGSAGWGWLEWPPHDAALDRPPSSLYKRKRRHEAPLSYSSRPGQLLDLGFAELDMLLGDR